MRRAAPFLAALVALAAYALTRAPGLTEIDSGELAAVAATFGIAHPPGYALWTVIAGAFARLPILDSVVARTNLLSGIFAAGAALVTGLAARELVRGDRAAVAGVLLAAGGATLWSAAVVTEVYSLHALLVATTLWLALRAATARQALFAAATLGVAITHHLSAVALVPPVAWLLARMLGRRSFLRALPALCGGAVAAGLLPLLWLPLRASTEPLVAWGEPSTPFRLWAHVTGAQYRVFLAEGAGVYAANLTHAARLLATDLTPLGLALGVAGAIHLGRRAAPLFLLAVLNTALCASYGIKDLAPYFLPTLLSLAILAGAGLASLVERLPDPRLRWAALCVALVPLGWNFRAQDRSHDRFIHQYAQRTLDALPPGAVLISKHFDALVSPIWYLQFAEGRRRDVVVVDPEMLRRSWYREVFARQHPEEFSWVRSTWDEFVLAVAPFERGDPHDPARLETLWRGIQRGLIGGVLSRGRGAFASPEVVREAGQGLAWMPAGLVFHLAPGFPDDARPQPPPSLDGLARALDSPEPAIALAASTWIDMAASAAVFEATHGRCGAAREIYAPVALHRPAHPGTARMNSACPP